MNSDAAHSSPWAIAEVVFGVPFLLSIPLSIFIPWVVATGAVRLALMLVGIVLFVAGVMLIGAGRRELARHRQPTDPGHPTSQIVTTGVFSLSRNPLYLGLVSILGGIGLMANSPWILVMLLLSILLCHAVLIFPEERYLAGKFGNEYDAYVASVSRWVGRR